MTRLSKKELGQILARGDLKIQETGKRAAGAQNATPRPRIPAERANNELSARFEQLWRLLDGPALETEYRFHPVRRWRADYCHPSSRTLIELEGGIYSQGRHTRAGGYQGDCEKYNAATMAGWRVIRLATGMVQPATIEQIIEFCNL